MPRIPEIMPVTVIHEVMDPSEMVRKLIAKLMKEPDKAPLLNLHSSAQRIIERRSADVHPRFHYAKEFRTAETLLSQVGRTALMIGEGTQLLDSTGGGERLVLNPRYPMQLDLLTSAMDGLPSIMEQQPGGHLYIQFAADSLTRDIGLRRDVLGEFDARSRHPGTKPYMKADNPRIVMRDVSVRRPAA